MQKYLSVSGSRMRFKPETHYVFGQTRSGYRYYITVDQYLIYKLNKVFEFSFGFVETIEAKAEKAKYSDYSLEIIVLFYIKQNHFFNKLYNSYEKLNN